MGHFAKIIQVDNQYIVDTVIVADPEDIESGIHGPISDWVQTSYNTRAGKHYITNTQQLSEDQSKALRKNYAGIGYIYDPIRDAFYPPKPFPSHTLNEETCMWEAPVPYPSDRGQRDANGNVIDYYWNEETLQWINPYAIS